MSGEMVPVKDRMLKVRDDLTRMKPQIMAALPRHISPDRLLRITLQSIQNTPALLDCTPRSLYAAVLECATLGLEPGVLGHAYLVPYKGRVQMIPGYKGLIDLAKRSGAVLGIEARVVYEKDEFDFEYGDAGFIRHRPYFAEDPGKLVAAWAMAILTSGFKQKEVMPARDVLAIKKRSPAAARGGPWATDEPEMWRKTVVRRLCKYLPLSSELSRAVALDERIEAGIPQNLEELHPDIPEDRHAGKPVDAEVPVETPREPEPVDAEVMHTHFDEEPDELDDLTKRLHAIKTKGRK